MCIRDSNNISVNTGKKTINSYKYVQITNSYCKPDGDTNGYLFKDEDNRVFVSIATAVHEMGHIMGLKDLYNSKNASPVYFMSVMEMCIRDSLYPMSILNGERSSCEFTGITFAGAGQNLDTGMKVVHNAPATTSVVSTKSISKGCLLYTSYAGA